MKSISYIRAGAGWAIVLATVAVASAQATDRFTAMTANMNPSGEGLRIDLLRWSSEEDRQAVLDVISNVPLDESGEKELSRLVELPTLGYVWPSTGGVGYSVKYAHRLKDSGGGERITLVTSRPLGTYSRAPWRPEDPADIRERPFSVLELRLDPMGQGAGKLAITTDLEFDVENATVALENYDAQPVLLEPVERQP